jgi:hypothetical protein
MSFNGNAHEPVNENEARAFTHNCHRDCQNKPFLLLPLVPTDRQRRKQAHKAHNRATTDLCVLVCWCEILFKHYSSY